ncbi:Ger(x)C family spore germination protein [Herbivorax sp. ANBcel31]|uniref:Ger(x)C family spore germination protein n=1 Tax=Herbivorax sp. ANBcel31 TaxID=3069754 RepID=UPI0027AEDFBB|nr:Ger(x)C family spore germination protein [Herbivorax sp. ANBcel31]MDQ2085559.1 Ger(x)C family spore germination protein [Herbivorax sp. ANBcel31]
MKNKLCLFLIFSMLIFTSSCRFRDIDRRAFVVAIGLDLSETKDEFDISIKVAIPRAQSGESDNQTNEDNFILYRASDKSIGEAIRKIKAQMSLEPDFSHLKAIVVGKETINQFSFNEIITYFVRKGDVQQIAWIMVGTPSAKAVLSLMPLGENIAGNYLFMKFGQGVEPQFVNITKIFEAFSHLTMPGVSVSCPLVEIQNENFAIEKTAIFHNGKLEMILKMDQTRILNILKLGLDIGFISTFDKDNKPIGIRIRKASGKISLDENANNSLVCNIDIKVDGFMEESSYANKDIKTIEKKFEDIFKNQTLKLMKDFQSNNLDPLALQVKYWAKRPEFEFNEDWVTEIYPKIEFNVNSNVKISHSEVLK